MSGETALARIHRGRARSDASAVLVRLAERDDHPAIRDLLDVAHAQYADDIPAKVWGRYRADLLDLDRHARNGQLLVAVVDGDIAGYGAFYSDASTLGMGWPAGWAGGRGLAVHPRHRSRGVAAALIAAVEQYATDAGAPVFAFHTADFMATAQALYQRLGFRRAPEFDIDMTAHYGVDAAGPLTAVAYLKHLPAANAA